MHARPISSDPAKEVIRSLATWPDADLFRLARAVAGELLRRELPQPAALPIVAATYAAVGASDLFTSALT